MCRESPIRRHHRKGSGSQVGRFLTRNTPAGWRRLRHHQNSLSFLAAQVTDNHSLISQKSKTQPLPDSPHMQGRLPAQAANPWHPATAFCLSPSTCPARPSSLARFSSSASNVTSCHMTCAGMLATPNPRGGRWSEEEVRHGSHFPTSKHRNEVEN
jgi:hypothetical protein